MSSLIIEVPSDIFSAVCERLLERWSNRVPTVRKAINPPLYLEWVLNYTSGMTEED